MTASDVDVALAVDALLVIVALVLFVPLMLLWYAQGSPTRRRREAPV